MLWAVLPLKMLYTMAAAYLHPPPTPPISLLFSFSPLTLLALRLKHASSFGAVPYDDTATGLQLSVLEQCTAMVS